jgi:hypothetical protein
MRYIFQVASLCILFSIQSANASTSSQLEQATKLLQDNQPSKALVLLEDGYDKRTASTQELFLLGLSAKLSNNFQKAERYFKQAVNKEPDAGRIYLELAEVLYRQGKFEEARTNALRVKKQNPPPEVQKNIDVLIAEIDKTKNNPRKFASNTKKNWNAYLEAGISHDSNVNAGPDTDTVFLYGLPFTLSSNAKQTEDTAYFLRGGINHQKKLNNTMTWQNSASFVFNNYLTADDYDHTFISLSTGLAFNTGERSRLYVPINLDVRNYDKQDRWFSQTIGVSPSFAYGISKKLQLHINSSLSKQRFKDNSSRDLNAYTLNPYINYQPQQNQNLSLGFILGKEDSNQEIYSNDVSGAYIGFQHSFNNRKLKTGINFSYTDTEFEGIQPAYTEARKDISKRVSLNASYLISELDVTLRANASYQDNNSNLDINNYDREYFSLSLLKQF